MGQGLLALAAADMAAEGRTLDDAAAAVEDLKGRTHVYGVVDSLDYLRRGGRIGGAAHLVGSLLSIKPVIEVRDGVVEVESKQRTRTRSLQYLAGKALERGPPRTPGGRQRHGQRRGRGARHAARRRIPTTNSSSATSVPWWAAMRARAPSACASPWRALAHRVQRGLRLRPTTATRSPRLTSFPWTTRSRTGRARPLPRRRARRSSEAEWPARGRHHRGRRGRRPRPRDPSPHAGRPGHRLRHHRRHHGPGPERPAGGGPGPAAHRLRLRRPRVGVGRPGRRGARRGGRVRLGGRRGAREG